MDWNGWADWFWHLGTVLRAKHTQRWPQVLLQFPFWWVICDFYFLGIHEKDSKHLAPRTGQLAVKSCQKKLIPSDELWVLYLGYMVVYSLMLARGLCIHVKMDSTLRLFVISWKLNHVLSLLSLKSMSIMSYTKSGTKIAGIVDVCPIVNRCH